MPDTLLIETHDAVTLVRFNRPRALNCLNQHMLDELVDVFAAYEADATQRCLVVTGNEKLFIVGADVREVRSLDFAGAFKWPFYPAFDKLRAARKPWFAAVAGYALGGGCELALMADFILAADTAIFGQPEIALGVAPGAGGSQRLTRAVGKAKAMDMCLSGRMMDAPEAERAGLVSNIVPAAVLVAEALHMARKIASMPPPAALAAKERVNAAFEGSLTQGLRLERRRVG